MPGGLHAHVGRQQQRFQLLEQRVVERAVPEQQIGKPARKAALGGGQLVAQTAKRPVERFFSVWPDGGDGLKRSS
jgi:hypothetical protein